MKNDPVSRGAPMILGGVLLLEAFLLLAIALFSLLIGGLVGGLAFVAGAGSATDAQVAQTFAVMALTLASPFVVAGALLAGGMLLMLRRGRYAIAGVGILAIAAQIAFHLVMKDGFSAVALVPLTLHLLTIVVGLVCVPAARVPAAVV